MESHKLFLNSEDFMVRKTEGIKAEAAWVSLEVFFFLFPKGRSFQKCKSSV